MTAPAPELVRLTFPVRVGGDAYRAFVVRPGTWADRDVLPRGASDEEMGTLVMALLCGVPVAVIDALAEPDVNRVGAVVRRLCKGMI